MHVLPRVVFGLKSAQEAYDALGANCGPGAIAGLLGCSPRDAVAHIPGFLEKGHTKETMMRPALDSMGVNWEEFLDGWPSFGLVRVLWHGPWWNDGLIARFMRSHWIASVETDNGRMIFDINAISVGGWLPFEEWRTQCVPYIVRDLPGADGRWTAHERFVIGDGVLLCI